MATFIKTNMKPSNGENANANGKGEQKQEG